MNGFSSTPRDASGVLRRAAPIAAALTVFAVAGCYEQTTSDGHQASHVADADAGGEATTAARGPDPGPSSLSEDVTTESDPPSSPDHGGDAVGPDAAPAAETVEETPEVSPRTTDPEPEHLFRDDTELLGLEGLATSVVSTGDVDGDGLLDLLVGGNETHGATATELYRGLPGGGFAPVGLADRIGGASLAPDIAATSVVDLNRDGRLEILIGSYYGGELQILWNRGDLLFDATSPWASGSHSGAKVSAIEVWDFNGDTFPDVYLSVKWPSTQVSPFTETHMNTLLLSNGTETFTDVTAALQDVLACSQRQTFSSVVAPGAALGRSDVLFVANDMSGNCAWDLPGGFPLPDFEPVADPDLVLGPMSFSMGADYMLQDDTGEPLLIVTDVGRHHAFQLTADGITSSEHHRPDHGTDYFGWGVALFDADNDGDQDAVIATGVVSTDEQITLYSSQYTYYEQPVLKSRIHYFERLADDSFAPAHDLAGPAFASASGEWYGVTRADLDEDGCVDVIVGVRQAFDGEDFFEHDPAAYTPEDDVYALLAPGLRVLMNNCKPSANRWVGLRVPDIPGTVVALERSDGRTVFEVVKGTVGVGSRSGGGQVHFGLGESLEALGATVYAPSGEVIADLGHLEAGAYHPVP